MPKPAKQATNNSCSFGRIVLRGYGLLRLSTNVTPEVSGFILPSPFLSHHKHQQIRRVGYAYEWNLFDPADCTTWRWLKTSVSDNLENFAVTELNTKQLLDILDERGIIYPPTASRLDLERLLLRSTERKKRNHDTPPVKRDEESLLNPQQSTREHMRRRSRRRQIRGDATTSNELFLRSSLLSSPNEASSTWSQAILSQVPRVAGNLADRAKRKARRIQQHAADFWAMDDDTGVRDVRYHYNTIQRDETPKMDEDSPATVRIEVIIDPEPSKNHSNDKRQHDRTVFVSRPTGLHSPPARRATAPHPTHVPQRIRYSDQPVSRAKPREEPDDPSWRRQHQPGDRSRQSDGRLPSNTLMMRPHPNDHHPRQTHSRSLEASNPTINKSAWRPSSPSPSHRKIYSPYNTMGAAFSEKPHVAADSSMYDDRDVVDRFTFLLAETADKVMWGMFDNTEQGRTPEHTNRHIPTNNYSTRNRPNRPSRRRHWKNRFEERLDSMLGLHENGDFYNRWTSQFENDESESGSSDAFSVAQGRRSKKKQSKSSNGPLWGEDGNWLSFLFVGPQTRKGNPFDNRLGLESGSLLVFFRACFKSFLVLSSHLCSWASTRGSLPQPVVVLGVTSAVLCAEPRRRLSTVVITLLLLRTVGELLHSYTYGSNDWDDDVSDGDLGNSDQFDGSNVS